MAIKNVSRAQPAAPQGIEYFALKGESEESLLALSILLDVCDDMMGKRNQNMEGADKRLLLKPELRVRMRERLSGVNQNLWAEERRFIWKSCCASAIQYFYTDPRAESIPINTDGCDSVRFLSKLLTLRRLATHPLRKYKEAVESGADLSDFRPTPPNN